MLRRGIEQARWFSHSPCRAITDESIARWQSAEKSSAAIGLPLSTTSLPGKAMTLLTMGREVRCS